MQRVLTIFSARLDGGGSWRRLVRFHNRNRCRTCILYSHIVKNHHASSWPESEREPLEQRTFLCVYDDPSSMWSSLTAGWRWCRREALAIGNEMGGRLYNYLSNFPKYLSTIYCKRCNIIMDSLMLVPACSKDGPTRKNRFHLFLPRAATQFTAVIQPYTTQ